MRNTTNQPDGNNTPPLGEKFLPANTEAEMGCLGSLIIDGEAMVEVADLLRPEDFYNLNHQLIYGAMAALYEDGKPADLITLTDALQRQGQLQDVGGASYVSSLANQVPTSANLLYYAGIVARTALNRRMIHAAGQIAAVAYNDADTQVTVDEAERLITQVVNRQERREAQTLAAIWRDYLDTYGALAAAGTRMVGVPTGLSDMDEKLGGLRKGDLILIGARPGTGKTSLAATIAMNAAVAGRRILLFSLEMGAEQIGQRFLAMRSGVNLENLRNGQMSETEVEQMSDAIGAFSDAPILVDDTAGITISGLRSRVRRQQLREPVDLVIVDYIGLMRSDHPTGAKGGPENRAQEVSAIARELKNLAREVNIPVLALSQLNRTLEGRADKRPTLADLKESGGLEENADVVMFLYRESMYDRDSEFPNVTELQIAKHRNGPTGVISLYFKAETTEYKTLARTPDTYAPTPSYGGGYAGGYKGDEEDD